MESVIPAMYTLPPDIAIARPWERLFSVTFHTSTGCALTAVPEAVKTELTKIAVKATKPIVPILLFMIYPILYKATAHLKLSMCGGSGGRAANLTC
jgi:hypothetical protein